MEKFTLNNTGIDPFVRNNNDATSARFGHLNAIVDNLNNNINSGTYTPVISGEVNGVVVNPNGDARFMRIGSNVIVFAQLEITMDTGENTGSFEISLPVASELTSQKDCFGMMQLNQSGITTSELDVVVISAETTNNTCLVDVETLTAGFSMAYCTLQFTYQVQ
jgi:hypothetical protein